MPIYANEEMNKLIDNCLKTEEPTDICRFWHYGSEGISVLNKEELREQFTQYKKTKKLKIENYNNKMIKRNGRKFYVLVVQWIDKDKETPHCPMSMLGYGFLVGGYPYWFNTKKDRNYAIDVFNDNFD